MWGGWDSNPRPMDYEKYGPVLRVRSLHGYHEVVPPIALIALLARVARSTPEALRPSHPATLRNVALGIAFVRGRTRGEAEGFHSKPEHGNPKDVSPATRIAARWPPPESHAARPSSARPQAVRRGRPPRTSRSATRSPRSVWSGARSVQTR